MKCSAERVVLVFVIFMNYLRAGDTENEAAAIKRIFSACHKKSPEFDMCMKRAFNKLRPYFKVGVPEMNIGPFDPHHADVVRQMHSIAGIRYTLVLKDVYEWGWTKSLVTKFKTDWTNNQIVYSQYFPEKWLNGKYEFFGTALGLNSTRVGEWNITLRDYSQTTRIKRTDGHVDVHVEIDHLGDMELHVTNLLGGRNVLENMLDRIINTSWRPGFALVRPLINELVSTGFTDIWSKTFGHFPVEEFITE